MKLMINKPNNIDFLMLIYNTRYLVLLALKL